MSELRTAVVTGASRGIGRAIAERLAAEGWALTISARDEVRLAEVAHELGELGAPAVRYVAGDLASADDTAAVLAAHAQAHSSMNALVLAAGVGSAGTIEDYPAARYYRQFAVNTHAPFHLMRDALPMLRKAAGDDPARGAKIIAVASIGGVYAEPQLAAYGASKAALISLCRSWNAEEAVNGVSATAIAPAYVDTDMSAWIQDQIPAESMITTSDIVEITTALLRLSPQAVVPEIVVGRAGTSGYCA